MSTPDKPFIGQIAGIYWLVTVAIYLAVSLIGDSWDHSWIVWAVAGPLFAAVVTGVKMMRRR